MLTKNIVEAREFEAFTLNHVEYGCILWVIQLVFFFFLSFFPYFYDALDFVVVQMK